MKRICFLIFVCFCFFSCSQSKEKLLLGTWILTKADCENLTEFSLSKEKIALKNLEENIEQLERNLQNAKEDEKVRLQKRIEELSKAKPQVSEKVRSEIENTIEAAVGNMSYVFDENGKFTLRFDSEILKGGYQLLGDTISVLLDNQENDLFVIESVTASSLVLSNIQDEHVGVSSMKMLLNFKKK